MKPLSTGLILALMIIGRGTFAQHDRCAGETSRAVNGYCEEMNNNAECGYDEGDCCYCSCVDGLDNSCGFAGYDCRDPEVLVSEISECNAENVADIPCAADTTGHWVVNDTGSAAALADAILCSGGTFEVEWHGHVFVNRTIEVSNATVLRLTGKGPGARMEAALDVRLLTVINASLIVNNIEIARGSATYGGAIAAAANSFLSLDRTSLTGNNTLLGGGLYLTLGSVVSCVKAILFDGNHAGDRGGALYVGGNSSVAFDERTSILSSIGDHKRENGQSLVGDNSNESWAVGALFINTAADGSGDSLYFDHSHVSWAAEASFVNNAATDKGGAMFVHESDVSWIANASFMNDTAGDGGGALYVYGSDVSWADDVTFSNTKTAGSGGVVLR